jgi:hypothetical protein
MLEGAADEIRRQAHQGRDHLAGVGLDVNPEVFASHSDVPHPYSPPMFPSLPEFGGHRKVWLSTWFTQDGWSISVVPT